MNSATPETAGTFKRSPPERRKEPRVRGASLRWNFSWTFVGNIIYSGCQWGMLVVLAKDRKSGNGRAVRAGHGGRDAHSGVVELAAASGADHRRSGDECRLASIWASGW